MNQSFKFRFDQMRESNPVPPEGVSGAGSPEFYPLAGHARNLGLRWPDGKYAFLSYAYLIAGEFDPSGDQNVITLDFSAHRVLLYGYSLEALFVALLDQLPRWVVAIDSRYVLEEDTHESLVTRIVVEKKEH